MASFLASLLNRGFGQLVSSLDLVVCSEILNSEESKVNTLYQNES